MNFFEIGISEYETRMKHAWNMRKYNKSETWNKICSFKVCSNKSNSTVYCVKYDITNLEKISFFIGSDMFEI